MERGGVYNPARAGQLRDFTGLKFGTISPTDIDGVMDFNGEAFVYLEAKCTGAELLGGQKLFLENACRSHWQADHPAMALVVLHATPADRPIPFAECLVGEVFVKHWQHPKDPVLCRAYIRWFLDRYVPHLRVA